MDLMEYKAKELFIKYGIPAVLGKIFSSKDELAADIDSITYPAVIKAQVPIGGRGKAGGIRFANDRNELMDAAGAIFGSSIKGFIAEKIMVADAVSVKSEMYLAVTLDRRMKCPVVIFSLNGGMDIEQTAMTSPGSVYRSYIDPVIGIKDYAARYFASKCMLDEALFKQLNAVIKGLYRLFCEYNCLLCEINPLAVTCDDSLSALDGKITIDDSAVIRLPDMTEYKASQAKNRYVSMAEEFNFLYIPCDPDGDIAVMSNGSGMIMSCIDSISSLGMKVRASLDLGGGATADRIKEAVRIMLDDEKTGILFISIFGGITRCDEVASGIVKALEQYGANKPVIVRFEGTNKEMGIDIIKQAGYVTYVPGLAEGVEALKNEHNRR
jgi:succinyl-CoA synthetase beta subunit